MAPVPRPRRWTPSRQRRSSGSSFLPVAGGAGPRQWLPAVIVFPPLQVVVSWCAAGSAVRGSAHASSERELAQVQPHHRSIAARATLCPGSARGGPCAGRGRLPRAQRCWSWGCRGAARGCAAGRAARCRASPLRPAAGVLFSAAWCAGAPQRTRCTWRDAALSAGCKS